MRDIKACFSTGNDEWSTPVEIYKSFMERGYYDPCPMGGFLDGLTIEWERKNFVNPPYSDLKNWVAKAISENRYGKRVFLLIPARTDTKAFKALWDHGATFYFIIGRLAFGDRGKPAPFPSMLVDLNRCGVDVVDVIPKEELIKLIQRVA